MLQKKTNQACRIAAIIVLFLLLVLVRAYENKLFDDPLLEYFKQDFSKVVLPDTVRISYFLMLFFRYALNTILSLGIIFFVFREVEFVKLALLLYVLFFVVLICVFYIVVNDSYDNQKWDLFYVRRFIIQPIFLLLFLAGFYYHKKRLS